MIRPTRGKAWLVLAIVATLAAAPATTSAAAPAIDEYVLAVPGVRQTDGGSVAPTTASPTDAGDGVQRGVVGEQDAPSTPLAAVGDALSAFPAAFAAGLLALAAIVAFSVSSRRPTPHGTL